MWGKNGVRHENAVNRDESYEKWMARMGHFAFLSPCELLNLDSFPSRGKLRDFTNNFYIHSCARLSHLDRRSKETNRWIGVVRQNIINLVLGARRPGR